jgi:hypothetical protein
VFIDAHHDFWRGFLAVDFVKNQTVYKWGVLKPMSNLGQTPAGAVGKNWQYPPL